MATLQYKAVEITTERFKQLNCALCFTNGDFIENLNFCIECQKYYCPPCLNNHLNSQQAGLSQKRTKDGKGFAQDNTTGLYQNSNGNDEEANRNISERSTRGPTDNQRSQPNDYRALENALRRKHIELKTLTAQKEDIMSIMRQFKASAADILQDIEDTVNEAIKAEEETMKKKIKQEIKQLEKSKNNVEQNAEKSESDVTKAMFNKRIADNSHGSEYFSNMQNILETAIEDFTYRINKASSYLIEESSRMFLQTDKQDVRVNEDKSPCDINDMCQLEDGSILLCDWNNTKIKRLRSNSKSCSSISSSVCCDICPMPSIPWSICPVGPSEVAVSLFLLQRVQFVTVTSTDMTPTWNFKVGEVCRGICYTDNKLVVSCGGGGIGEGQGHLRIFNQSGVLLSIVQGKAPMDPVFSCPFHLTASKGLVYLTDRENGLVCLEWTGSNKLSPTKSATNQQLALAKAICEGDNGDLFICDFKNGTVVSLNPSTNKCKAMVQQKNKLTGPQALCYNSRTKQLFMSSGNSNYVQTYQLTLAAKKI